MGRRAWLIASSGLGIKATLCNLRNIHRYDFSSLRGILVGAAPPTQAIKEGISVGIPDTRKGEHIKIYVVLKDGETATPEEFLAYFKERLTPYKVPSEVEFREQLPKSMIGKVLRRALREEELRKAAAIQPMD